MLKYITNFFTRLLAYSGDLTEGLFDANSIFLRNVHVHMKLGNNASNKNRQYLVKFYPGEFLGSPHTGYGGEPIISKGILLL